MLIPDHGWSSEAGISRLEHPKMADAFAGKQLRWLITQRPVWATGIRHMRCRDLLCIIMFMFIIMFVKILSL